MKLLDGVTIVAPEVAESGPVSTLILAFLGAKVYHIERPTSAYPPIFKDNNHANSVLRNCNKYNLGIDSKREEGKELVRKMIEKADVFLENYAPGAWDRMGFSYEEVSKINPEIIYISLKGFAKASKWGKCVTIDPVSCASGGSGYLSGYEDYLPMMCGINVADTGTATHTALTIAMAVLQKRLTGKGQYIETPMQYAVIANCRKGFVDYYANSGKVRRAGNGYRGIRPTAPWNIYPALGPDMQGNHVAICCRAEDEYKDFDHLCQAMNRLDLLEDPRYATPERRYENRILLDAEVTKWTLCHTNKAVLDILGIQWGIPVGLVNSIDDVVNNPYLNNGEGVIQLIEDPLLDSKPLYMPTIPMRISDMDTIRPITCGAIGDGNHEVLCGHLGLSEEEYQELVDKKVI